MSQPALFLDRDGVINLDNGYTHRAEDFVFIDGIFALCRHALAQGFALIVVTNQAGIARGMYSEADFLRLTAWMHDRFAAEGAPLTKVYWCPFHAAAGRGVYKRESDWRKPNPGMLLQAHADFGIALAASVLVGDKASDIQAGQRAGVGTNLLFAPQGGAGLRHGATAVITQLHQALPYLNCMP
jgi:D-glycero-D-manno-heptose 1,7-bisphosphate phosphatase